MGMGEATTICRQTLSGSRVKVNAGIVKSLSSKDKKNHSSLFPALAGKRRVDRSVIDCFVLTSLPSHQLERTGSRS